MSLKRKLVTLTIAEKVNIISEVTKSGKQKNEIAKQFNIPPSTLSTILKNKDDIWPGSPPLRYCFLFTFPSWS